jgi:predicted acetyltransferase
LLRKELKLEIRVLCEDDLDAVRFVMSQAFGFGGRSSDTPPDPEKYPRSAYGVFDAHGLQATLVLLHLKMHLGQQVIAPLGGVAGVACLPASRGRGYAAAIMRHALEAMRDQGRYISGLNPFSWEFYRPFGFDWVGAGRTYTVPARTLPPDPDTEFVRSASKADVDAIQAVYRKFAARYRGMLDRSRYDWEKILSHSESKYTFSYLFEPDGEPEGYVIIGSAERRQIKVREMQALTPRAYRALLGLLRRHEMQTEQFEWGAPEDDPLPFHLRNGAVETRVGPVMQVRVVDVAAAMAAWRPEPEREDAGGGERVCLEVRDETAPWNDGAWSIEAEAGAIRAQRSRETAGVEMEIQALSQAYFGTPLDRIRAAGGLIVRDEAGYAALRRILSGPLFWINDYF